MISRGKGRRRIISTLSLTLIVVLAGCAGFGGFGGSSSDNPPDVADRENPTPPDGSDDSASDSTSESPDDPTSDLEGEGSGTDNPVGPFPIGTSDRGITDPTGLVAAHLGVLEDSSYTVSRAETHTTAEYTYSMESSLAVEEQRQRLSVRYAGQTQDIYRADNASPSYIRWESESGIRYLRDEGDVLFPGESAFFVQSLLEASTFEFVEQRTVDDRPVFVFSVTEYSETQDLRDSTPLESIDELDGMVYIRDDGLIVGMDVILTGPDLNEVVTDLHINEAFSAIGTTVITEPSWLQEAHDRAARMIAARSPGGGYISITMEHGDAIPSGSTGYLYIDDITVETTFEDGLVPDQAFYLFESADGELTVTMDEPTSGAIGASVPAEVHEVSVAIFHQDYGTVYASSLALEHPEEHHAHD